MRLEIRPGRRSDPGHTAADNGRDQKSDWRNTKRFAPCVTRYLRAFGGDLFSIEEGAMIGASVGIGVVAGVG